MLHVGCVGGRLTDESPPIDAPYWVHKHLLAAYPDVWGIDISPSGLEKLREEGMPNLYVADAENFVLDKRFETIFAGELIEHLANPRAFLQTAKRHLAPNGRIVITTPYAQGAINVVNAWVRYPNTCPNPEHTLWLCPRTLQTVAEQSGLEIESLQLIEDFRVGEKPLWLRFLFSVYGLVRWVIPKRIRCNCMIAVLVAQT